MNEQIEKMMNDALSAAEEQEAKAERYTLESMPDGFTYPTGGVAHVELDGPGGFTAAKQLADNAGRLQEILDGLKAAIAKISGDPTLSAEGKNQKIRKVLDDADTGIDFEKLSEIYGGKLANTEAALEKAASPVWEMPPTDMNKALRAHEIRNHVRGLSQAEAIGFYLANRENPETCAAIENAPVQLVGPEIRQRIRDARARERDPEAFRRKAALELTLTLLNSNRQIFEMRKAGLRRA